MYSIESYPSSFFPQQRTVGLLWSFMKSWFMDRLSTCHSVFKKMGKRKRLICIPDSLLFFSPNALHAFLRGWWPCVPYRASLRLTYQAVSHIILSQHYRRHQLPISITTINSILTASRPCLHQNTTTTPINTLVNITHSSSGFYNHYTLHHRIPKHWNNRTISNTKNCGLDTCRTESSK